MSWKESCDLCDLLFPPQYILSGLWWHLTPESFLKKWYFYIFSPTNKNISIQCEATNLFCTFHFPLSLYFGYIFRVVVINCKVFVQLSAFLDEFFFPYSNLRLKIFFSRKQTVFLSTFKFVFFYYQDIKSDVKEDITLREQEWRHKTVLFG